MTRDALLHALQDNNVTAFLALIRAGESNLTEDAYALLYGGSRFESFADHPRVRFYEKNDEFIHNGKRDYTTAAGAYQITETTWNGLVRQYGFADFTPLNQDMAAVALIAERHALEDIMTGEIGKAIAKLASVWASLPGAAYGQPTQKLTKAFAVYTAQGGSLASESNPVLEVPPMPFPILPLITAFGPELVKLIPQLGSLFGSGSEVATRNVAAASMVADALIKATDTPNLQSAVETMQANPLARQAGQAAVSDIWPLVGEVGGGGIKAAREAAMSPEQPPLFKQGPFVMSLLLVPLVYFVVTMVLLKFDWIGDITSETRAQVIGVVLGAVLGGIIGYHFGTSAGSARKTELMKT